MQAIRSIVHPTDFSEASAEAFLHALRIALAAKATLSILHVAAAQGADDWPAFPHIRDTLTRWGLMQGNELPAEIASKTGIRVIKVELKPQSTLHAIAQFLDEHPADLIVLASEARQGVSRWLNSSLAEELARAVKAPSLFVTARARGFVEPKHGEMRLRHVLIPVDHRPKPAAGVGTIMGFARLLAGGNAESRLLHVGKTPPQIEHRGEPHRPLPVALRRGDVVEVIVEEANDWPADLIGMPTAGHAGYLDALRGSTTERVIRQAHCPVLAVPAH